jgi:tRNA(Ile)-lysidine synthase
VNALDLEKAGDLAGGALVLRNCRPGDKYQRVGHAGTESLKNLFQEFRIPSWDRADWPVLTVGGSIAWVNEFGPAASFAADAASRTVLRIRQL